MLSPNKILLIDDQPDNRYLLSRTLFRKFPRVTIQECHDLGVAIGAAATEHFDAIVLHRSNDADAITLVRALRKVNETVPIIVVSGVDRRDTVLPAGATAFLLADEWLRIGTLVANTLEAEEKMETLPTPRAQIVNPKSASNGAPLRSGKGE